VAHTKTKRIVWIPRSRNRSCDGAWEAKRSKKPPAISRGCLTFVRHDSSINLNPAGYAVLKYIIIHTKLKIC